MRVESKRIHVDSTHMRVDSTRIRVDSTCIRVDSTCVLKRHACLAFFFLLLFFLTTRSAGRIDTHTFFVESTRIVSLLNRHALRHTNPTAVRAESTRHFLLC
jgi:hypothetical protein